MLTEEAGEDITEVIGRLAAFVRDRRDGVPAEPNSSGMLGLLRAVQSEPQRHALDQLLVLGTLLEGHADHVMDAVGPAVVPSVATIRRRFDERRNASSLRCNGLCGPCWVSTPKMSQYTRGKAFVDHVVGRVGMARFNTVWSGPKHCRCQPKSKSRSDGSTGCSKHAAGRGGSVRPPLRRRARTVGASRCRAALIPWR